MEIELDNVKILNLTPTSTLVLTVDTGNLPKLKAEEFMKNVSDKLKQMWPDNKVLVLGKGMDLSVVETSEDN